MTLAVFGEITFDHIGIAPRNESAESVTILHQYQQTFGGRGANVAAAYSHHSKHAAKLLSIVGPDFESTGCRTFLEGLGVDCSSVAVDKQGMTPRAFVFRNGSALTYFYPGFTTNLSGHQQGCLDVLAKSGARALYCTSGLQEINYALLASFTGGLRIYAPGPEIFHYSADELDRFLKVCDALFLNDAEAQQIILKLERNAPQVCKDYALHFIAVTKGALGSLIVRSSGDTFFARCRPDAVVDATGAGDSYAGAFLASYLKDLDCEKAALYASVASSFTVETIGCLTNLPTKEAFLKRCAEYETKER